MSSPPAGVRLLVVVFDFFFRDTSGSQAEVFIERSIAASHRVQEEDISICEAVQRGLRSKTYQSGRYSVARENGLHHFHGLLSRFLQ